MSGKITIYIDCVSPYSYLALVYLEKNRAVIESHDVKIDIVPVFLGGIMGGSGNKPPWTLAQKADYSKYDTERAKKYFGLSNLRVPDFFPIISLLPQRALVYVKSQYPQVYVQTFLDIFAGMWEDGYDVSKSELLSKVLSKRFDKDQVGDILEKAKKDECKQALNANTKESLDRGAFGCPWFWVRNSRGQEQPFFGSDRFPFMWEYLGLPWKDVELLPASAKAKM